MQSYYFTEEHEMFRKSLKQFLDKEVAPNIIEWEKQQRIPRDIWKKMGEMGFLGLSYPEEYGGVNLDFFYDFIFCEETSKVFSGGFTITQLVVQYMSGPYILKHGSEALKKKYLPGLISGEMISSIGITEPSAGSDVLNIKTTAIKNGDHYIVNGSKTFITNAVYGDIIVTVVKTDPEAGAGGFSLLILDRNAEGVSARKLNKLGWHASDTAELNFDNVKVPVENLVGEEGQGFYYLMGGLQLERLVGGISAIAACESALEYTLQYMSERKAFGRSINKFQVLRHRMAQLTSEVEVLKQYNLHCARLQNDGVYAVKECSMAKLLSSELSDKVVTQCLQSFGGYGYMEDFHIARMFRDSRILTIGAGSSEIMREIIAKMVIDDVSYQPAGSTQKANKAVNNIHENKTEKSVNNNNNNPQKQENMSVQSILPSLQEKVAKAEVLGKSIKFDFGAEKLYIDGKGATNQLSTEDKDADCLVIVSFDDFMALIKGELNPMAAVMSGKAKIKGDMGAAMKLNALFA